MTEDAYTALVREIETVRGRQDTHEAVCALRYKGIAESLEELKSSMRVLNAAAVHRPQMLSRWAIRALVGIMSLMLSVMAWEAKQLYDLEVTHPAAQTQPWWQFGPRT